jgi:hypothetical protein
MTQLRWSLPRLWHALVAVGLLIACGDSTEQVGSRDCKVLVESTQDPATRDICALCQGVACGTVGCETLPCSAGQHVVQGCAEDSDCAKLDVPFCGKHSAPDNVCVKDDDL